MALPYPNDEILDADAFAAAWMQTRRRISQSVTRVRQNTASKLSSMQNPLGHLSGWLLSRPERVAARRAEYQRMYPDMDTSASDIDSWSPMPESRRDEDTSSSEMVVILNTHTDLLTSILDILSGQRQDDKDRFKEASERAERLSEAQQMELPFGDDVIPSTPAQKSTKTSSGLFSSLLGSGGAGLGGFFSKQFMRMIPQILMRVAGLLPALVGLLSAWFPVLAGLAAGAVLAYLGYKSWDWLMSLFGFGGGEDTQDHEEPTGVPVTTGETQAPARAQSAVPLGAEHVSTGGRGGGAGARGHVSTGGRGGGAGARGGEAPTREQRDIPLSANVLRYDELRDTMKMRENAPLTTATTAKGVPEAPIHYDVNGKPHIGYGHLLPDEFITQIKNLKPGDPAPRIPNTGIILKKRGAQRPINDPLSWGIFRSEAENLFQNDFNKAVSAAQGIPNFDRYPQRTQESFIEMTFQMGDKWYKPGNKNWTPGLQTELEDMNLGKLQARFSKWKVATTQSPARWRDTILPGFDPNLMNSPTLDSAQNVSSSRSASPIVTQSEANAAQQQVIIAPTVAVNNSTAVNGQMTPVPIPIPIVTRSSSLAPYLAVNSM